LFFKKLNYLFFDFKKKYPSERNKEEDYVCIGVDGLLLQFSNNKNLYIIDNVTFGDFIKTMIGLKNEIESWLKNPIWSSPIFDLGKSE